MLSSLESINSFYYLDVDAIVSLTKPALKHFVEGPKSTATMSETETVLCVVQTFKTIVCFGSQKGPSCGVFDVVCSGSLL